MLLNSRTPLVLLINTGASTGCIRMHQGQQESGLGIHEPY